MDCAVYRKVVNRANMPPDDLGGLPTLGGLAVLDSEDEPDVDWDDLGYGKLLITEAYGGGQVVNRDDAIDMTSAQMYALVEFVDLHTDPDRRVVQKHDVVYLLLADEIKIAYEVMEVDGAVNIPPYARKYLLSKRDDLTYIGGFPD
ncbi:hypothetical protein RR42_m1427 [Cupriavidus basilensis]|uniref:Uncharacterized protein n=2 Tax=Cupriavidus basilensis TaxID=68895 RepID=A0A0C4Y7B7_9BURK|nr:hypothetical protein RR42_m1427 [Cupriavidus basilensis]